MPKTTLAFALLLVILGVGFAIGTGMTSWTPLIPSMAGLLFALCGFLGLIERYRKHAMHISAALALLGFLGTAKEGILGTIKHMVNGQDSPPKAYEQALMATFCLLYVALAVRSFVRARRRSGARDEGAGQGGEGRASREEV